MSPMSVKDIQDVCLDILKEFHSFCITNNLRYSLEGGTLLGAIRHQGYIPWDNDVDVMMPRPDYNRFVALYKDNEKYACFADEKKNGFIAYARLADMKRTYVKPVNRWANRDTGVWIDVFPVDGVENNKKEFDKTVKKIFKLWRNTCLSRDAMGGFGDCGTFVDKLKLPIKKLIYCSAVYRYLYHHLEICHRFDYDSSDKVSIVAYSGDSKLYFPRTIMEKYVEVPFENTRLYAIENYHLYLSSEFGDYMQLPPVNQRFVHDMHCYYWRD